MPEFFEIDINILVKIVTFLQEKRMIFHPVISPNGVPDFSYFQGRNHKLILDRNILTMLIQFVRTGELKDQHSRKIISSLLLWVNINNVGIVSSFALMEYSYNKQCSYEANNENKIFLEILNFYHPEIWMNVAIGREKNIPKLESLNNTESDFLVENEHFKMHYLEMLKLAQLYFTKNISPIKKLETFAHWVLDNLLICRYTTFYAILLLFGKSKLFMNPKQTDFDSINKKCLNQAWDLTYLSLWSTLHYYEDKSDDIFLFSTADNELKRIFINSHKESIDIYFQIFGKEITKQIFEKLNPIYKVRRMPKIDVNSIENSITLEREVLREKLINYGL